ncbi:MAG: DUF6517 family protein [Halobacteriota archaeon]
MYSRRGMMAVGGGLLASTSGCLGFVLGDEPLAFEAERADVPEGVVSETGYELERQDAQTVTEDVSVGGQTREVAVTNQLTIFRKAIELPVIGATETGVFAIVSTPTVEIAGQKFNPVSEYDDRELLDLLTSEYGEFGDIERIGSDVVSFIGEQVSISTFRAETTVDGQSVEVLAHVGATQSGDDVVVGAGIYPEAVRREEESNVSRLFEAVEHPV